MPSDGNKVVRLKVSDLLMTRDGSVPNKDARLTNCFIEDVNGSPQILKRSGYALTTATTSAQGHGATVWTNSTSGAQKLYCVAGSSAYIIAGGTSTNIINGTFAVATNEMVDWLQTFDGTSAGLNLILKCSTAAYGINTSTDVATKIASNYPTSSTARGLVYMEGTYYVMDKNGKIYGSDSNDIFTWSALNFIFANTEPDGGVALAKSGQYVVAFGNYTTEYFYNVGNATGSPLSPVQNGAMMRGCAHAGSIAYGDGAFFLVTQAKAQGQATGASYEVGKVFETRYQTVSTPSVDRIISSDGLAVCFGNVVAIMEHVFYTLSLPASSLTLALDLKSGIWYVFTVRTTAADVTLTTLTSAANVDGTTATATATKVAHGFGDGDVVTMAGATPTTYNLTVNITVTGAYTFTYQIASVPTSPATGTITATGTTESYYPLIFAAQYGTSQIAQHVLNGGIYTLSDTTYTDATIYIDSRARTARMDGEKNQQKFCAWMDVVTDRASANALVRYTDDDYQTYSKYRKTSLAGKRSRLNRQGSFKRRAFEIRVTDNIAFRFQGLDLAMEEGIE